MANRKSTSRSQKLNDGLEASGRFNIPKRAKLRYLIFESNNVPSADNKDVWWGLSSKQISDTSAIITTMGAVIAFDGYKHRLTTEGRAIIPFRFVTPLFGLPLETLKNLKTELWYFVYNNSGNWLNYKLTLIYDI